MHISIYVNLVKTFSQNDDFRRQSPYNFACVFKSKAAWGESVGDWTLF